MSVKEISESLDSLPDRLAALLDSKSPGGGDAFTRASGKAAGVYEMTPDVYGLKEDAGKPDRTPPKAPWGNEPDVPTLKEVQRPQSNWEDGLRGKYRLPGTAMSLGSFAADTVGQFRSMQNGKLEDRALDADERTGSKARFGSKNQEADHSDERDRQGGKSDDDQSRQLVEAIEQLRSSIDQLRSSVDQSKDALGGGDGGGPGNGFPGLGQVLSIAKMAGS